MNATFNFNKENEIKETEQNIIIESVNYLTERFTFTTMKDTEEIYYYDSNRGIHIKGGIIFIKSELSTMHVYIASHTVHEIINTIKSQTYTDRKEFDSKIEWVACENCMLNLLTGEDNTHSPEFMATIQIPVIYKKKLQPSNTELQKHNHCPRIMRFLHQIVSNRNDVDTILDFIAYCLWGEMRFHKILILNGEGRNGKSTLC